MCLGSCGYLWLLIWLDQLLETIFMMNRQRPKEVEFLVERHQLGKMRVKLKPWSMFLPIIMLAFILLLCNAFDKINHKCSLSQ
jgi:hypothetical protein